MVSEVLYNVQISKASTTIFNNLTIKPPLPYSYSVMIVTGGDCSAYQLFSSPKPLYNFDW